MHFVHRPYQKGETIAAVATPPGEGGVAIIRISGDRALEVAEKVYSGKIQFVSKPYGPFWQDHENKTKLIDEVLLDRHEKSPFLYRRRYR